MTIINDHDRFASTHVVTVYAGEHWIPEPGDPDPAQGWRPECSCGWTGHLHTYADEADAEGEDHCEIAVGPGDGLDRVMSELLDVQDDLAQVVMWLAENWAADLPVPAAHGGGSDRVEVRMNAYCTSAELLTRTAAVMGVPLVDDPAPDTQGYRYRRAVRQFGRVTLYAYREIEPTDADRAELTTAVA